MKITLPQLNKILTAQLGPSLFKILRENDIPVASSCLGDGVCGKCVLKIEKGSEQLPKPNALESKLLQKYQVTAPARISCQLHPTEDLTVTSTYW